MSKILFIENRTRTRCWKLLAAALRREGHEIFWIVENHAFAPSADYGTVFTIPYPTEKDLQAARDYRSQYLPSSDRAYNYFGHRDTRHYGYYFEKIGDILRQVRPNLVLGESTAFHELLVIDVCQKLGILFLHPCTCRYPTGRFAFYQYSTLEPYRGSGEELTDAQADAIINSIAQRKIVPDYMKKNRPSLIRIFRRIGDLLSLTCDYYGGEHYHTPSPFRKIKIERELKSHIQRWNVAAERKYAKIKDAGFKVLYPLHMQPEANLDIWGNPYRDQARTVRLILDQLPAQAQLVVKPNPKAKYEMTDELLSIIENNPRVLPVPLPVPMGEVLPQIGMVVTVTGTIAIECILSGKPVVTLIKTLNNMVPGCPYVADPGTMAEWMKKAADGSFPQATQQEKRDFIRQLNRTSYAGLPYENYMTQPEEFEKILSAVKDIL